jgi:Holliday junction resolvase RusA-like endonuclease
MPRLSSSGGQESGKGAGTLIYEIVPVAKPRMTRKDKWAQRPSVLKYRAYKDEVRLKIGHLNINFTKILFAVPMPKSWSKKKKAEMQGKPHEQTPDLDNFLKGLMDALYGDDSHIHTVTVAKIWDYDGYIMITMPTERLYGPVRAKRSK